MNQKSTDNHAIQRKIDALPQSVPELRRMVLQMGEQIDSYETAKRQRDQQQANNNATGKKADYEMELFTVRSDLEGMADGSVDYADPIERVRICRSAIALLNKLFADVPNR